MFEQILYILGSLALRSSCSSKTLISWFFWDKIYCNNKILWTFESKEEDKDNLDWKFWKMEHKKDEKKSEKEEKPKPKIPKDRNKRELTRVRQNYAKLC